MYDPDLHSETEVAFHFGVTMQLNSHRKFIHNCDGRGCGYSVDLQSDGLGRCQSSVDCEIEYGA